MSRRDAGSVQGPVKPGSSTISTTELARMYEKCFITEPKSCSCPGSVKGTGELCSQCKGNCKAKGFEFDGVLRGGQEAAAESGNIGFESIWKPSAFLPNLDGGELKSGHAMGKCGSFLDGKFKSMVKSINEGVEGKTNCCRTSTDVIAYSDVINDESISETEVFDYLSPVNEHTRDKNNGKQDCFDLCELGEVSMLEKTPTKNSKKNKKKYKGRTLQDDGGFECADSVDGSDEDGYSDELCYFVKRVRVDTSFSEEEAYLSWYIN